MIDGSEKCNCQLAFELQISHVCEKRSKAFPQTLADLCFMGMRLELDPDPPKIN